MLSKEKLNIVIPMAGAGSRFEKAGFTFPKPLIEVIDGKPMIQVVVESIGITANYIYLVNTQYYEKYNLKYLLNIITPNCKIICVDKLTEGAACTVLLAKEYINNDQELLIANSDQYIEWNPLEFFYLMQNQNVDGGVLTFRSQHPKWSYAKVDDNNIIQEIAEKCVISNISTVGIYYWKQGKEMVWAAEEMIRKNIRTNGEFYLAPSINESIQEGKKFKIFDVDKMFGLGTPEDLQNFKDQINTKKSYN